MLRDVKVLVTKYYRHSHFQNLNSADKKRQFSKKVTFNAIILGIRMCSTGLLFRKNQKGSTCYLMLLDKRDSTTEIFL